eukprot:GHVL01004771.1.p1 GENE.GHVL01004771.1~~GHVL01004771.1.p1  ORF type:complete len:1027 (+),score=170.15 GHVL01004771.1:40-3081(+)
MFVHSSCNVFRSIPSRLYITTAVIMRSKNFRAFGSAASVQHNAYKTLHSEFVPDFNLTATIFEHKKTGAQVVSLEADDPNKVFAVSFRTPVSDSMGIPHIIEHSVLCGSEKYPIKLPFIELLKGSLYSFLNAMTYPDRTVYPIASPNVKDFYNLANVYMDAVFHPRAAKDKTVMQQEGWHYEYDGRLSISGVVYNEMKGEYDSPETILFYKTLKELFPDNAYSHLSGGDPKDIPKLKFEKFLDFYKNFYHPSNCKIIFYGNDEVCDRLDFVDERLKDFERKLVESRINWQKKFETPKDVTISYPASSDTTESKDYVTLNWVVNHKALTAKDKMALAVLGQMLLGDNSALLKKALIDSKLGSTVVGGGFMSELQQVIFSVGLKDVQSQDSSKDEVQKVIMSTLEDCVENGFPDDAIESAMNTVEFSLREANFGSHPKGLIFALAMVSEMNYDQDGISALKFEGPLKELKDEIQNKVPIFQELLKKYLLENTHRVRVRMVPDTNPIDLNKDIEEYEKTLSEEELNKIIENSKKLKEIQRSEESPEDLAKIPHLTLDDIDKKNTRIPREISSSPGTTVLSHPIPSQGIIYLDFAANLTGRVSLDEIPLLPLLRRLNFETGTSKMTRVTFSRQIGAHTGGIQGSFEVFSTSPGDKTVSDPMSASLFYITRGKCVIGKMDTFFDILEASLNDANLDSQQRSIEILKQLKADMELDIIQEGHSFADSRIKSRLALAGLFRENMSGYTFLQSLKTLINEATNDWPSLRTKLLNLRKKILSAPRTISVTADADLLKTVKEKLHNFSKRFPNVDESKSSWNIELPTANKSTETLIIPSNTNFVALGGQFNHAGHEFHGSSNVISRYLSKGYMMDNIRVLGGAYGAFFSTDILSGLFSFVSYRDPNFEKSLKIYRDAADHLINLELSDDALLMAKLGAIRDLDNPLTTQQQGVRSLYRYLSGISDETMQTIRDEILATKKEDFYEFGKKLKDAINRTAVTAAVASQDAIKNVENVKTISVFGE